MSSPRFYVDQSYTIWQGLWNIDQTEALARIDIVIVIAIHYHYRDSHVCPKASWHRLLRDALTVDDMHIAVRAISMISMVKPKCAANVWSNQSDCCIATTCHFAVDDSSGRAQESKRHRLAWFREDRFPTHGAFNGNLSSRSIPVSSRLATRACRGKVQPGDSD